MGSLFLNRRAHAEAAHALLCFVTSQTRYAIRRTASCFDDRKNKVAAVPMRGHLRSWAGTKFGSDPRSALIQSLTRTASD